MDVGLFLLYIIGILWFMAFTLVFTALFEYIIFGGDLTQDILQSCLQPFYAYWSNDEESNYSTEDIAGDAAHPNNEMNLLQQPDQGNLYASLVVGAEHQTELNNNTIDPWLPRPVAVASKLRTKLTAGLSRPCAIFKRYIYPDSATDEDGQVFFDGLSKLFQENEADSCENETDNSNVESSTTLTEPTNPSTDGDEAEDYGKDKRHL